LKKSPLESGGPNGPSPAAPGSQTPGTLPIKVSPSKNPDRGHGSSNRQSAGAL